MSTQDISHHADSSILDWISVLSLVFGGCCSNVFALEAVLKSHSNAGIFLTFVQFLYVACQTLASQLVFDKRKGSLSRWIPSFKTRVVPIKRWTGQVIMFLAISLLNNYAFGLKVPVPVHIIFRSGGLGVSMAIGWLVGKKRYSKYQVLSVVLVTSGIIVATMSAPPKPKGRPPTTQQPTSNAPKDAIPDHIQYILGVAVLSLALVISAFMGLFQEKTYSMYGRGGSVWQESIFYSHALSLPFFLPFLNNLSQDFAIISNTPPATFRIPVPFGVLPNKYPGTPSTHSLVIQLPSAWIAFALNIFTQGLCIGGVNRLTSKVSSVSVNLILTVRKAVSLGISVWFYGAGFNPGLIAGAAMVLTGSVLYSMAPGPAKEIESKDEQAIELDDVSTPSAGQTSSVRPLSRTEDLTRRKPTATIEEIED